MLQLQSSPSKIESPPYRGGGHKIQTKRTKRTRQQQKILNKKQKATRKKRRTYRKNRHKCIDAYSESFMLFNESLIEPCKSNVNTNKEDNEIVLLATDPTVTNTHLNILRKASRSFQNQKTSILKNYTMTSKNS